MVSNILEAQESTLRKYCAFMEKHNYKFNKNLVGHRIFYKKDVNIIEQLWIFKIPVFNITRIKNRGEK